MKSKLYTVNMVNRLELCGILFTEVDARANLEGVSFFVPHTEDDGTNQDHADKKDRCSHKYGNEYFC